MTLATARRSFVAAIALAALSGSIYAQTASTPTADPPDSIQSFIQCINGLGLAKGNIDETVQCVPDSCKVTLTMSTASAQNACAPEIPVPPNGNTRIKFQFPRVLLDCPGTSENPSFRFRPSYSLCPAGSAGAGGVLGINRIEVGEDITTIKFQNLRGLGLMMMADVPVPPGANLNTLSFDTVLSTKDHDKGCNEGTCHIKGGRPPTAGTDPVFWQPFNPFSDDFTRRNGTIFGGKGYVIYTNSSSAPNGFTPNPVAGYTRTTLRRLCNTTNLNENKAAIEAFYQGNAQADTSRLFLLCSVLAAKFPGE